MDRSPLDLFLEACQATGPLGLEAEDASGVVVGRWSLPGPFAVIGRDPRNEVTLIDRQVSRHHAAIQIVAGGAFWLDLGSRTGVTRGGIAEASGWLPLDETVGIGPFRLRLKGGVRLASPGEPARLNPLASRVPDDAPVQRVNLELPGTAAGDRRRFVPSRLLTLVGRTDDCRLQLADDRISRFHAALVHTVGDVWLVDLLSRDGLRVNGARTRWAHLAHGDRVDFGPFRVTVRFGEPEGERVARPALMPPPRASLPAVVTRPEAMVPDLVTADDPVAPLVQQFGQLQQQMFDQFQQAMQAMLTMVGSLHRDQMGQIHKELERIREITQELSGLQDPRAPRPDTRSAVPGSSVPPAAPPRAAARPVSKNADAMPDKDAHDRLSDRIATLQKERQSRWQSILKMVSAIGGADATP